MFSKTFFTKWRKITAIGILFAASLSAAGVSANCDSNQCSYSNIPFTKAGFYVAQVRLEPGSQEGFWGLEANTSSGANTGGFNAGTVLKENGQEAGFVGFYLGVSEQVRLTVQEYSGQVSNLRVVVEHQDLLTSQRTTVYGPSFMASGDSDRTERLAPGFYVASAASQNGDSRGRFGVELLGESFTGGVNVGGWIDDFTGGNGEGFGAFYVASPQTVNLNLLFGNNYGTKGAGPLALTILYQNPVTGGREAYWDSASGTTNSPPVASPLSSAAHAGESLQINLLGSDPDGDTLVYELLSSSSSAAYDSAYIQGNVLYIQMSSTFDSIGSTTLEYRVTDGQQFSQPATVTLQAGTTEGEHGLGLQLVDPYAYSQIPRGDLNGRLFGAAGDAPTLPRRIDLSDSFPIPGDQGQQGSCVAWATAYALKSYQERMEENWSLVTSEGQPDHQHIFSPAFIYNQINGGQDQGSDPYTALQLIVEKGAATLATMPYNDSDYWTQPSATAFAEAAKFKGASVEVADGTLAIKSTLANRVPVVAGIFVYDSLHYLSGSNAVYNSGGACTPGLCGGHAVTIVGYDDDKFGGAFKIINSWGRYWGDGGYFWLPYEFARQSAPWSGQAGSILALSLLLRDKDNTGTITPNPNPNPNPVQNLPNLQVEDWSATYDERPGGAGELQYSIINTGTATVPAYMVDVNLMLSADSTVSSNDIYVVYETIPLEIGPWESVYRDQNSTISFYFPSYIPAGTYYMGVWVDDLNRVQESNEYDNFASGEQMVHIQDTLPDLVVKTWYTEWDDYSGNGVLEYEVANEGMSSTRLTDWDINLVLSGDEIIGNGDEWALFYEHGNYILEPGRSVSRDSNNRANFQLYEDAFGYPIPAGIYYMAVWVDDMNREQESDEYNNSSLGNELVFIGDGYSSLRSSQTRENYNGKPLPRKVMLRKVQILDTPEGKRQLRFLEEELKKTVFDKQQRSANQVIFPTARRVQLPKEVSHERDK